MRDTLTHWLINANFPVNPLLIDALLITLLLLIAVVADLMTRRILLKAVRQVIKRSPMKWDDLLVDFKVMEHLAHLAPAVLMISLIPNAFADRPNSERILTLVVSLYLLFVICRGLMALLSALEALASRHSNSNKLPLRSIAQLAKLFVLLLSLILGASMLIDRSPMVLLSGLGAFTAVLLLVFKDTILGFVAGLQLAANDMVRCGDWIEVKKFGADGAVQDVGLTTVKVQNWDKTITTVPTYALFSDAFKNWRGMEESSGRRIKRSLHLDVQSIKFLDEETFNALSEISVLSPYLEQKRTEIGQWHDKHPCNHRQLTNIGTFRAYLEQYLKQHPLVNGELTLLVRQLAPTSEGLPIELYLFSNDKRWAHYEALQADLFDHIFAILPVFGLRAFQAPSGQDFQRLTN
ncbi:MULTISPECIES: mechanosensitive ion channel family protein [Corallincola]|uniref:Mechanosensing system component YbdG n=2 Tax=Corallincola TaxID=1775176 RepID=A0A368N4S9_9GAMM|nr:MULTISPECIES: mechanosensitive ion channel domain-containing protein [Corallincola]RCU45180.1 mechanosensitive ion channel family protein [Corallincola holothuriorum]TAA46770.1 mechanosensitive ion channel [Corallincola spongiicola]